MPYVDFSRAAGVYDRRPGGGPILPADAAREIAEGVPPGAPILDIGAGTGRVTLALTALGFRVIAIDAAQAMLEALRGKAAALPTRLVRAEGACLPFPPASFDAVVLSRILYLMSDWRVVLREVTRVLRAGGGLLHEWGNGEEDEAWVQIREHARTLFEQAGLTDPFHPGVRSEGEVDRFLTDQGMKPVASVRLGPGPSMPMADFLRTIETGDCSYVWNVPVEIQRQCLPALGAWAAERFDLDRPMPFPREIRWTVYRK